MKNEQKRTDGTKRTIEAFLLVFFQNRSLSDTVHLKKAGILL